MRDSACEKERAMDIWCWREWMYIKHGAVSRGTVFSWPSCRRCVSYGVEVFHSGVQGWRVRQTRQRSRWRMEKYFISTVKKHHNQLQALLTSVFHPGLAKNEDTFLLWQHTKVFMRNIMRMGREKYMGRLKTCLLLVLFSSLASSGYLRSKRCLV